MSTYITVTTIKVRDDGEEDEVELRLPCRFEVCHRCQGSGKHVNPNVDGHGITAEEFAEDPDFREFYFGGVYDVTCYECHGDRVTKVIDRDACKRAGLTAQMEAYEQEQAEAAQDEADDRHTRRMENGGFE